MSKVTVDEAVEKIGNRFDLVLVAAERAREIARGSTPKVSGHAKPVSQALEEVEQGYYTKQDYLNKIHKRNKE